MGQRTDNFKRLKLRAALAVAVLSAMPVLMARADETKADNALPLNDPGSWAAGTAVPGPTKTAIFDGTLVTNHAFDLGDDLESWGGVLITSPALVTINPGHTLTLGAGGISMAATAPAFSYSSGLVLAAAQSWNTSTNLTLGGNIDLGANALFLSGGGQFQVSPSASITGSGTMTFAGSGKLIMPGLTFGDFVQAGGTTLFTGSSSGNGTLTLTGGTLTIAPPGPFANPILANGNAVLVETANTPTLTLSSAFFGGGTISYQSTNSLFLSNTAGQFSGFSGLLAFGGSSAKVTLLNTSDHALGSARLDMGTGSLTLSTHDGGTQSIGALSGGSTTTLRGASNASAITNYVIGGANVSTTFAGAILDGLNAGASTGITKVGTGTLTLSGTASAYSGSVQVQNGVLSTNMLTALGKGTDAIVLGTASTAGTWQYTGTTATTERLVGIASTGTVDASGSSGSLTLSNTAAISYVTLNQPRTLTLSGSNTNVNTFDSKITNNGAAAVSLVKSGGGTWLLASQTSAFSGGTNINGGVLLTTNLAGKTSLGSGTVNVNAGGAFGGTGVTSEDVFVNAGGHLEPGIFGGAGAASNEGMMNLHNVSLAGGSVLDFDVDTGLGTSDQIGITDGGSLNLAGQVQVNLFLSGTGAPPATTGSYILLSNLNFSTSFSGSIDNFYVGDPLPSQTYQFSIANTATDGTGNLLLNVSPASSPVSGVWTGAAQVPNAMDWSTAANWQAGIPGANAGDAAAFGAAGPGGSVTLNGLRRLGTLTLAKGSAGSGYTLAAGTGGKLFLDNGTGAATIVVGSGAHLLTVDTELDSNTVITSAAGSSLSISGVLSNRTDGTPTSLAIVGSGSAMLLADDGFSGDTSIGVGASLQLGNGGQTGRLPGAISDGGELVLERAGSVALSSVIHSLAGSGTLTQGGGTLALDMPMGAYSGALQIKAGAVVFSQTTSSAAKFSNLLIEPGNGAVFGGTFDVADDRVVIESTGATGNKMALISSLQAMTAAGKGGGSWNGLGITSAVVANDVAIGTAHSYRTTVAIADNGALANKFTTFGGLQVDGNSLLITRALIGDGNLDNTVNNADLVVLFNHFGAGGVTQTSGDYDGNGTVNNADLVALFNDFGQGLPGGFSLTAGTTVSVTQAAPENSSLVVLAFAWILLHRGRKRRLHFE